MREGGKEQKNCSHSFVSVKVTFGGVRVFLSSFYFLSQLEWNRNGISICSVHICVCVYVDVNENTFFIIVRLNKPQIVCYFALFPFQTADDKLILLLCWVNAIQLVNVIIVYTHLEFPPAVFFSLTSGWMEEWKKTHTIKKTSSTSAFVKNLNNLSVWVLFALWHLFRRECATAINYCMHFERSRVHCNYEEQFAMAIR